MEDKEHINAWYAAKVFFNKMRPVETALEADNIHFFTPSEVIPSLIFIHTTDDYIRHFQEKFFGQLWVYCDRESRKLSVIPDQEMEIFIFVASAGQKGLLYLGDDKPEYHQGDKVRVTDGPFKGAVGYIKRIKKDRRLIVSVKGVAAIATAFIHPQFLEIVTE